MALQLGAGDGFNRDLGDQDGKLTFAEAVVQVNGQKLIGPERRPLKSDRPVGDVTMRFRNYARILNEARAIRHTFKVLYFSKLHNQAVAENKASYLNKFKKAVSKVSKAYAC